MLGNMKKESRKSNSSALLQHKFLQIFIISGGNFCMQADRAREVRVSLFGSSIISPWGGEQ
jgi:hypothetical protein